ncbi:TPA: type 1 fimbrial protein subunit FimA, partial [Enterobacter cancerogenus]
MNKIAVATGFALALCAGAANAGALASGAGKTTTVNGGTVHFKGKLVAAPCAVSNDTSDQTVKLGE